MRLLVDLNEKPRRDPAQFSQSFAAPGEVHEVGFVLDDEDATHRYMIIFVTEAISMPKVAMPAAPSIMASRREIGPWGARSP